MPPHRNKRVNPRSVTFGTTLSSFLIAPCAERVTATQRLKQQGLPPPIPAGSGSPLAHREPAPGVHRGSMHYFKRVTHGAVME
jgi:hypothetical protein